MTPAEPARPDTPLPITQPSKIQEGGFLLDAVTPETDPIAFKLLKQNGFEVAGQLGEGYFSTVYLATNGTDSSTRFPHVVAKVIRDVPDAVVMAKGEYQRLNLLGAIQQQLGLPVGELYTPIPLLLIGDDKKTIEVMEAVPGTSVKDIVRGGTTLTERQTISGMTQVAHLFSILESQDTDGGILLGMGRDMYLENIFFDVKPGNELVKTKLIDWSLFITKDQLQGARENERSIMTEGLAAVLMGSKHNINAVAERKTGIEGILRRVDAMTADEKWNTLNSAVRHIILKGFGVLKSHPQGYASHGEMLDDFLKVNGIPALIFECEDAHSAAKAMRFTGDSEAVAKSIVLIDSNSEPLLIIILGKDRIDFAKVKKLLNVRDVRLAE
ncbi:hypothetical protein HY950_02360, partial [Candidatus Gottesmanbacteria bacterium]|nr:hypothetical protein [Candidatus Gottesmanbacteria bacterium]